MKNGLSNEQVEESRRLHGSNKLPEPKQKKWYHFAKEAADGTKAAFDASADVQQKRLDKKMKDEAIDKKLQELKVRKGK